MQDAVKLIANHKGAEEIWSCSHAPVYTTGYRAVDNRLVARLPAPTVVCDRGGETTFHGPGQLMLYPLLNLKERQIGVRDYVHALEQSCIVFLQELWGIDAFRHCGLPGVWSTQGKLVAIGLKVTHGVVYHGMALNIDVNLDYFAAINPCGSGLSADRVVDHAAVAQDYCSLAEVWKRCLLAEL
ncbi:MAG: lipoyl(octanoyl) transferase LipB [Zetaproteobacteria bacterium]|nr:lipoyl(octanoyl) transferase LipB [Zetaproteobacteria bacterium]